MMAAQNITSLPLIDRLPPVRGRLEAHKPLGSITWFGVGGPAEVLFRPADRDSLAAGLRSRGHRHVTTLADPAELAGAIAGMAEAGDLVVCLGAGSSTAWANALPGQLKSALAARSGARPGADS